MKKVVLLPASILVIAAAFFFWRSQDASVDVTVVDAELVRMTDDPSSGHLFFQVINQGDADALVGASSRDAASIRLMPIGTPAPIPADSAPIFAMDGVHLGVSGLPADLGEGAAFAFTLAFEKAGSLNARALVAGAQAHQGMMMQGGEMAHGGHRMLGADEPHPTVDIAVQPADGGWTVDLTTTNFTFASADTPMEHEPGVGHAHLYLNGLKLQRLYEKTAVIGPLLPGNYTVQAVLNTNDHQAYMAAGKSIEASATLTVPSAH